MKGLMLQMLKKMTCAACVVFVLSNASQISCSDNVSASVASSNVTLEDLIVKDAMDKLKYALQNKGGKVERVSCKFELHKNQPLKATTKAYYLDYHKKPDVYSHDYTTLSNIKADSVIEVTYIPRKKDSLSLVHKDARERRLIQKTIDLPHGINA